MTWNKGKQLTETHKKNLVIASANRDLRSEWKSDKIPSKNTFRNWLIREQGEKCKTCGWREKRADGKCPIQINHIDGNSNNWTWENLELLCPNCHSLTPKFLYYGQKHTEEWRIKYGFNYGGAAMGVAHCPENR